MGLLAMERCSQLCKCVQSQCHLGRREHGPTYPSLLWMAFYPRPSNVFISMRCDYVMGEECLLSVRYLSLR